MNSIEEKLWAYIDGSGTVEEQNAIRILIEQDEIYKQKYNELLALTHELEAMELDEPPMGFTYNVMETIRADYAKKPLKAKINKNIVKAIGGFFTVTIAALFIMVLANINWSAGSSPNVIAIKLPDVSNLLSGPILKGFLFFDIVLVLFLLDSFLRKRSFIKQS